MVEHKVSECPQEKRITKTEMLIDKTIDEFALMRVTLESIKALLSSKVEVYDAHVREGEAWRNTIMAWLAGAMFIGAATACGYGIWVGTIQNDVRRLQALHPYGTAVSPIYGKINP